MADRGWVHRQGRLRQGRTTEGSSMQVFNDGMVWDDRGGQANECLKHGADNAIVDCTMPIEADSTDGAEEPCTSRVMGLRGSTCEPHEYERVHEGWSERCHHPLHRDGPDSISKAHGHARGGWVSQHDGCVDEGERVRKERSGQRHGQGHHDGATCVITRKMATRLFSGVETHPCKVMWPSDIVWVVPNHTLP
ncbi:hypothetical protein GOP47_0006305 [Adiantum capillus-veneris]|uniref:Uncharacterized protein n=1 Tax=Adiantum capillus-veneris TaxID=13818 RepID=A0A9D4V309_ADICA|nr:hypothetical protein GOP47_0006305 [Adiantum capillus-veneris]